MPLYDYYCPKCDNQKQWEGFHSVENRGNEICSDCGGKAYIALSVTAKPIIQEYYSDNLQAQITGPAQKKRLMRAKGLEETG